MSGSGGRDLKTPANANIMPGSENHRSIAQINRMLRSIVEAETLEHFFWVGGRIDRLYKSNRGHMYFDLIDAESRIRCVFWEERQGQIQFDLRNHLDVEVYGDVHFYERSAEAQVNVMDIRQAQGSAVAVGPIDQLRAEGLYPPVKKDPPTLIRRIGILTSRGSRATGDFETAYQEAGTRAVLPPVSWQYALLEGDRAAQSIADGIDALDANRDVDMIVIARGGGRSENLAPFDETEVLRAIIRCNTYVVTGIGHHRDHVLADDVADYVVATPTAAAVYAAEFSMKSRNARDRRKHATPDTTPQYRRAILALLIIAAGSLALLGYVLLQNV